MSEQYSDQPASPQPNELPFHSHGLKPPSLNGEERPRFELETPYGPNQDETGVDKEFVAQTLHIVRDGWEEMRTANPDFYVGMAVHGSFVKGRAHENSDVDGIVFYDPDSPYAKSMPYADMLMRPNLDIDRAILRRLEQNGYPETYLSTGSYDKVAMNEEIVSTIITDVEDSAERLGPARANDLGRELPLLFCMRIGSGKLQQYRRQALDTLSQSKYGEDIWHDVMDELEHDEEARRGATIYLPRTITEAYDYFRIANPIAS